MSNEFPTWSYDNHLSYYLMLLGRFGGKSLESIDHFPDRMALNGQWQNLLDQMRNESQDGIERWAYIGINEDRGTVALSEKSVRGEANRIPYDVAQNEKERVIETKEVTNFVGRIHSHPKIINWQYGDLKGAFSDIGWFSAADLYFLVHRRPEYLTVLVEGDDNLFAFRTRESHSKDNLRYLGFFGPKGQKGFEKYWYERNGIILVDGHRAKSVAGNKFNNSDRERLNLSIAERHKLVFYRGKSLNNLAKIYPR